MATSTGKHLAIGMDVGSTTVKAVVVNPANKQILWSDYQRHHTKQPEYVLQMLEQIVQAFPNHPPDGWKMFLTGSGSSPRAMGGTSMSRRSPTTWTRRPSANCFTISSTRCWKRAPCPPNR